MEEPVGESRGKESEVLLAAFLWAVGWQRLPSFTHGHRWGPFLKATAFSPGSEIPHPSLISLGLEVLKASNCCLSLGPLSSLGTLNPATLCE